MAKLFKRGAIWFARVPKRGGGTKRVTTLCTSRRAAEAALAQLEREAVDPAYAASNRTSTQLVVDEYYRSRERIGRAEGTLHHVRVKAGHLVRLLPARALEITHAVVQRYVSKRLEEGARRTTIKKELRVLKAALKLARRNDLWAGEPDKVIPQLEDDYRPGERALTPWELVSLAATLPPKRAALVVFAVATGCEPSALWRVTRADVAPDLSWVQIHGKKRRTRERRVPLPMHEQRGLLAWALARAGSPLLFEPWANSRRDLHLACVAVGIDGCTLTDLRRTFGTWLRNAGVEPQLIGSAMGHVDSRMVERVYGRLTPDALGELLGQRLARGSLMGHVPAVSGHGDGLGANVRGLENAKNAGETRLFRSAQGWNRTTDTGIFSPSSVPEVFAVNQGDSELLEGDEVGARDTNGSSVRGVIFAALQAIHAGGRQAVPGVAP